MLSVENLELRKNNQKIFSNLGFSLFVGASLEVKGKNGSGKTSLLKIITGISKQSSGKILWAGKDIEEFRPDFNADLQYLGHKNFLKQELSVYDNLNIYASLHETTILIPSALSFFKIAHLKDKKVKTLSAGMQKRVMLAKLLTCPATIWILDEPTTNLDKEGRGLLHGLIKTKLENQGMVIIATHEENFLDFAAKINMEDFHECK